MPEFSSEIIVHTDVPRGCELQLVKNGSCEPYFHAGEFVVIDLNDRAAVDGEVYSIQWQGGQRSIMRLQITDVAFGQKLSEPVANFWPLFKYKKDARGIPLPGQPLYLGDGGLPIQYLPDKLRGRVLGVYCPAGASQLLVHQ